jgi:hypothetical protein
VIKVLVDDKVVKVDATDPDLIEQVGQSDPEVK